MAIEIVVKFLLNEAYAHPLVFTVFVAAAIVAALMYCVREHPNLPPGPRWAPFVGNMLQLNLAKPHESMAKMAKKYGPVYRMYFGDMLVIILNDYDAIREAFCGPNGEACSGRSDLPQLKAFSGGKLGIIASEGARWKEQRRFTLSMLRNFGIGRPMMESKVADEVDKLVNHLDKLTELKSVEHFIPLKVCAANIISSIIIGHSFTPSEPDIRDNEFIDFQRRFQKMVKNFIAAVPIAYIKGLRAFVPFSKRLDKIREYVAIIKKGFLRRHIDGHLKDLPTATPLHKADDFTTAYLLKMKQQEKQAERAAQQGESYSHFYSLPQLESIINDLFFTGQETTVTTVMWIILYMLKHPEIQAKLQAEIEIEVGKQPTWDDRSKLPYTMAVIAEVQRLASVAPIGVTHKALSDVSLRGYSIPKGALLVANLWSASSNEADFPEPEIFKPERFIDTETGLLANVDRLIPYSIGKRVCLCEGLARMELFLVTTALFHHFSFEIPEQDSSKTLDFEPILGGTLNPKPHNVKIVRREVNNNS